MTWFAVGIAAGAGCAAPVQYATGRNGPVTATENARKSLRSDSQIAVAAANNASRQAAQPQQNMAPVTTTATVAPTPDYAAARAQLEEQVLATISQLTAQVKTLQQEISKIDSEMARCKKQNTGWKAATIVGGVGTVGTAVGAIVQVSKMKQSDKAEKSDKDTK